MEPEAHVRIGYKTHTGRVRSLNEDSLLVDPDLGLFIVADGLGGHNAGDVASSLAVRVISGRIRDGLSAGRNPVFLLQRAVMAANDVILTKADEKSQWRDMGTTIAVALLNDDHFLLCHVGDSRIYSLSDGSVNRLTIDHTFVEEWVKSGLISRDEARIHAARHGLTMALGVDDDIEPVLACLPWSGNECLLLCTDGLTEMLDERTLLRIIQDCDQPEQACEMLVDQANKAGGIDNITVILICP